MRKTVFVIQRGLNPLISVNNLSFQSRLRSLYYLCRNQPVAVNLGSATAECSIYRCSIILFNSTSVPLSYSISAQETYFKVL